MGKYGETIIGGDRAALTGRESKVLNRLEARLNDAGIRDLRGTCSAQIRGVLGKDEHRLRDLMRRMER